VLQGRTERAERSEEGRGLGEKFFQARAATERSEALGQEEVFDRSSAPCRGAAPTLDEVGWPGKQPRRRHPRNEGTATYTAAVTERQRSDRFRLGVPRRSSVSETADDTAMRCIPTLAELKPGSGSRSTAKESLFGIG